LTDGRAQRGQKLFMLGDCASCHHAMFREPALAARAEAGVLQAAEVVFAVAKEAQPAGAAAKNLHGGAYTTDLTTLSAKVSKHLNSPVESFTNNLDMVPVFISSK
jgi:hypothetical protein